MTSVMRPDPRYELALASQVPHTQTEHPDTSAVAVTFFCHFIVLLLFLWSLNEINGDGELSRSTWKLCNIFRFPIFTSSVETYYRWDWNVCDVFVDNFLTNHLVKEFWKSVHICQSYYQTSNSLLFWKGLYRPVITPWPWNLGQRSLKVIGNGTIR